jgi:hypothetical protein
MVEGIEKIQQNLHICSGTLKTCISVQISRRRLFPELGRKAAPGDLREVRLKPAGIRAGTIAFIERDVHM